MKDKSLVLYGDVQIYQEDLENLLPGQWINDSIIEFTYEYFEQELFSKHSLFGFIRPAIVYLISQISDPISLVEDSVLPAGLHEKEVLFMPINDNRGNIAGGTHWSLMVYCRSLNHFFHFDSMGNCNEMSARWCQNKIKNVLGTAKNAAFTCLETPQQKNGYDCGVYVIAITKLLASRLVDRGFDVNTLNTDWFRVTNSCISESTILNTRKQLFSQISQLSIKA
jgi:sentrin-specific protease 8